MDMDQTLSDPPTRQELEGTTGPLVLEFGAAWCGYCRAFAPHLAKLLAKSGDVQHVKVEDGPGQRLGRSFGVTLWPTLVFLRDGKVVSQLARPSRQEAAAGLRKITGADAEAV